MRTIKENEQGIPISRIREVNGNGFKGYTVPWMIGSGEGVIGMPSTFGDITLHSKPGGTVQLEINILPDGQPAIRCSVSDTDYGKDLLISPNGACLVYLEQLKITGDYSGKGFDYHFHAEPDSVIIVDND